MGSVAKNGLQRYMFQLQKHPLRTKMITAGTLSAISDIVSQKLSGIQKLQLRRILLKVLYGPVILPSQLMLIVNFSIVLPDFFGAAYLGPLGHFFHMFLDKIFKGKKDPKTIAKKVVVEQVTVSPLNNLLFMLYFGSVIEGRPWFQVKSKLKKEYPAVQYAAWTFWPVVGWINHQYVPLQLRVIFHSFVAFGWGIFLNSTPRSSVALIKG